MKKDAVVPYVELRIHFFPKHIALECDGKTLKVWKRGDVNGRKGRKPTS